MNIFTNLFKFRGPSIPTKLFNKYPTAPIKELFLKFERSGSFIVIFNLCGSTPFKIISLTFSNNPPN